MPRGIILGAQIYDEMHITKIYHAYDMHIYLLYPIIEWIIWLVMIWLWKHKKKVDDIECIMAYENKVGGINEMLILDVVEEVLGQL